MLLWCLQWDDTALKWALRNYHRSNVKALLVAGSDCSDCENHKLVRFAKAAISMASLDYVQKVTELSSMETSTFDSTDILIH